MQEKPAINYFKFSNFFVTSNIKFFERDIFISSPGDEKEFAVRTAPREKVGAAGQCSRNATLRARELQENYCHNASAQRRQRL